MILVAPVHILAWGTTDFFSGNFDRYVKTTKRQIFLEQMDRANYTLTTRTQKTAGLPLHGKRCCEYTFFSIGLPSLILLYEEADATIITAPSSTKDAAGKRDPKMHQTKKANQWG